ncbi:MAG: dihydropteroate synthase [Gammaproteobacteria bacterium]|nr:dihydropteroate synthase [Gammaproteobacteria bacterium]
MQGEPTNMQDNPRYDDLLPDITRFLLDRMEQCEAAGISIDRLLLDPGFGFGKTLRAQNLTLIDRLRRSWRRLGRPVLVGPVPEEHDRQRSWATDVDRLHGKCCRRAGCRAAGRSDRSGSMMSAPNRCRRLRVMQGDRKPDGSE